MLPQGLQAMQGRHIMQRVERRHVCKSITSALFTTPNNVIVSAAQTENLGSLRHDIKPKADTAIHTNTRLCLFTGFTQSTTYRARGDQG